MGFRKHNGQIKTYFQNKIGLTPIYTKGVVLNNGINIVPLNVWLLNLFLYIKTTNKRSINYI